MLLRAVASTAVTIGATLFVALSPAAAADTIPVAPQTEAAPAVVVTPQGSQQWRTVVVVVSQWWGARTSDLLYQCHNGGTSNITCSISQSFSVSQTITGGFGLSQSGVASNLGWSWSSTQSLAVQCSKTVAPGGTFSAYPYGHHWYYYLRLELSTGGQPYQEYDRSPTYYGFDATGISCV